MYLLQIYKNMPISRGNVSIFSRFPRLIDMFCDFYPNMDEFPLSILYNYSCISATMKSILSRLTQAVSGTDKELFSEQELNQFASFYLDKWDENTSEDVVAESFVDYWWNTDRACRRCSECGKLMREGYCADMGVAYYCSKECLHSDFTDEEWAEECESNDQSYYTEW